MLIVITCFSQWHFALQGCIYEITCNACKEPINDQVNTRETRDPGGQTRQNYVGMTMSSVHARMKDHLRDQKSKLKKSPMFRHDSEVHQGVFADVYNYNSG